jgi:hypothetical protein
MPAVQTNYNQTMRPALAGMKTDMSPETIVSRQVEGAAGLAFGAVAVKGTGDRQVKASAAAAAFAGIALIDPVLSPLTPPTNPDQYNAGEMAALMLKGTVWVVAGEAVAAGDPVYFVPASGALMKTATGNTQIANARWDTSAASGALAVLRLL